MVADRSLSIVVVYSPKAREVFQIQVEVRSACTVEQAMASPALLAQPGYGAMLKAIAGVAIWGKRVGPDQVLSNGDRLELCRGLTVDPKVARRERFAKQGAHRAAGLFAKRRVGAKPGY